MENIRINKTSYANADMEINKMKIAGMRLALISHHPSTTAADHVPPPLVEQLKNGGRMVIPVGSRFFVQQLVLITKDDKGKLTTRQMLPVRFVPLTGKH